MEVKYETAVCKWLASKHGLEFDRISAVRFEAEEDCGGCPTCAMGPEIVIEYRYDGNFNSHYFDMPPGQFVAEVCEFL